LTDKAAVARRRAPIEALATALGITGKPRIRPLRNADSVLRPRRSNAPGSWMAVIVEGM